MDVFGNKSIFNNRGGCAFYRNYGLVNKANGSGYVRVVSGGIVDGNGTIFTGRPLVTNTDPNAIEDPVFIPVKGDASCGCA